MTAAAARALFVLAADWAAPESMSSFGRIGILLAVEAQAPHAGWP